MNYTVDQLFRLIQNPFLPVDFNEMLSKRLIMLSQHNQKADYFGNSVELYEGLPVVGYCEDEDIDGNRDDIILEGICVPNQTGYFSHVIWLIESQRPVKYVSDYFVAGQL